MRPKCKLARFVQNCQKHIADNLDKFGLNSKLKKCYLLYLPYSLFIYCMLFIDAVQMCVCIVIRARETTIFAICENIEGYY